AMLLRAPPCQHGRQVGAAAEPGFGGDDHAGVHVDGRHIRIARMGDERDAGSPETRILVGSRYLPAEFGRELAMDCRAMNACLLEQSSMKHGHDAAAALCASMIRSAPVLARETAWRLAATRFALQPFKFGADVVAQCLEPGARGSLSFFQSVGHGAT